MNLKKWLTVLGAVLLALILLIVVLELRGCDQSMENPDSSSQTDPSQTDSQSTEDTTDPSAPTGPSEENPMFLTQDLYILHIGNFSGRYVEDGSDAEMENICAVLVENRSDKTLQLAKFQVVNGTEVYEFSLTTLPAGERAIVQDLNKAEFTEGKEDLYAVADVVAFFPSEPSLHEDVFSITGDEGCIELRNRTETDITGTIYVYYKTRTPDGYAGGITYRVSIPGLKAGETYQAFTAHFWAGSSQVMFIEYAQ